ncbi:DMT family transporter [Phaeovulum vinaykumarii]|jgi:drug/metabolite transporter (DMT)-like permease|uniref:Threonine/homoserine efflux transporter RhtA n=1 Tax=Phaeovulum vinaykumarii TaxID=407234 RepID=A0A1N7MRF7_9RHOB|nr:DMT family transporter [Phaeovulum vinaykumarii]SIS88713.1 Threonine/homoserine efflux transporter RhtA [Phaeovulum vinaykumarii]SOC14637.1 threonine/homoserine efflux transporter RhtA [Phaeovulum vinaykumarii]
MNHALILNRAAAPAWSGSNTGMVFMALAMLLLPAGDTFAKILTGVMGPVEVTMWRLLAQGLCLLPIVVLLRRRLRGAMFSPVVALSGLLVMITLTSLVTAFSVMPIATAIAIFFAEPLILTLLAGPLLGEVAGPRRYAAVGVGLVGALIVIRPGFSEFGLATLLPLVAATAYALNMIVLRRACATRSGLTVQCGATVYAALGMVGVVCALSAADVVELAPLTRPAWTWGAILGCGAFAAASFVLIAEAFRHAEATALAPFQYLEIVGATAAGFLVFSEFPDGLTWLGVAIILGSGAYIVHRERQRDARVPRRRRGGR